ncbi:MAG: D-alanyl-D-alanine carboxypeptidase [Bacilli bacterium]|nr:D-alanyl-D-alanine carboxypeptidase [Bacilli bacterium]
MKKILLLILLFILSPSLVKSLELPVDVTADSVILVNRDDDRIIYTKNPDKEQILASLTKVMTLYTAINRIEKIDQKVKITEKDVEALWGFTQVGLKVGDVVTYKDLLYATNLTSGADAAQALALHISGSMEAFVEEMNKDAKELGLNHTHFSDTIGKGDDNVSTAREFYILLKACLENELFERIFNTTYYKMSNGLESINYTKSIADFHGLDSNLITGNKSGYTPEAGLLLASTATINNTHYMLITMHSKENQWKSTHVIDSWKIYNYLSNLEFKERTILKKGKTLKRINVENGTISEYLVTLDHDVKASLTDEEYEELSIEYHIVDNIDASTKKGTNLGYVDIYVGEDLIDSINVYLNDKIFTRQEESRFIIIIIIALAFTVFVLLCTNITIKRKRRY